MKVCVQSRLNHLRWTDLFFKYQGHKQSSSYISVHYNLFLIYYLLTLDFQQAVMAPCDPLLFGHVLVKEQLMPASQHQTNGFTLSRPRDFISALTKERDSSVDCSSGDNSQTSTTPGGNPSTVLTNSYNSGYISSDAAEGSRHRLRAQLQAQSSCFSSASDDPYSQDGEVDSDTEETAKRER